MSHTYPFPDAFDDSHFHIGAERILKTLGCVGMLAGAIGICRPSIPELQDTNALMHLQATHSTVATERSAEWYIDSEAKSAILVFCGVGMIAVGSRHSQRRRDNS
jgi:hypothetical protein